jgi:RNA polymerase sigma-70 factor (ECF subfamily)
VSPTPLAAPFAVTTHSAHPAADLADLFGAHGRRLFRLALRLNGGDRSEAEDLVQETFLRAARRSRPLPADGAGAEAWLVRVLVNLTRDRYRRRRVRGESVEPDRVALTAAGDPAAAALARHDVRRALARLPARRRAVIVLHELEELDTAAIARLLGIARVTVRWHLAAGRAQLARELDHDRGGSDDDPE